MTDDPLHRAVSRMIASVLIFQEEPTKSAIRATSDQIAAEAIALVRADEREKIEVLLGNSYNAGWRAAVEKSAPVINAARGWVERIVDPPNLWADEEDFALIEAVNALGEGT